MGLENSNKVYLKNYQELAFEIHDIYLTFHIADEEVIVTSELSLEKSQKSTATESNEHLILNGKSLELLSVKCDGKMLTKGEDFLVDDEKLEILNPQEKFQLEIQTKIYPHKNFTLEGLYKSGDLFCTQNEPEGFRRITYFIDRPDCTTTYKTKIVADKKKYPHLLSNGNLIEEGDLDEGKHFALWEDPFKKPCYLFALVAGNLGVVTDSYQTKSGRNVQLKFYVDKGNESKCQHAVESLKNAMKWDEETYGLEYDLDIYMVVAVDSFNMGAMENKGLNIFNTHYVLADVESATDKNFQDIEAVVGHEYFHNWTGNRVTCRDWFQLTLKEGLTVFREQQFSGDMSSPTVQRIKDVALLREFQFPEDAGPNKHPIRPDNYIEINNFYTSTIYEKGAEVIRMVHTLTGEENFKKGLQKYFELYDGQAVTTEDFIHAMSQASGINLEQFKNWYKQIGTPEIKCDFQYDQDNKKFFLTVEQTGYENFQEVGPLSFPLSVGLVTRSGKILTDSEKVLSITKKEETFEFSNIHEEAIPSINRHFSAPIKVQASFNSEDYFKLFEYDNDLFIKYESFYELTKMLIMKDIDDDTSGANELYDHYRESLKKFLMSGEDDFFFMAKILNFIPESILVENYPSPNFNKIHHARESLQKKLATDLRAELLTLYKKFHVVTSDRDQENQGKRALKNMCLFFLAKNSDQNIRQILQEQYLKSPNMTDQLMSMQCLTHIDCPERNDVLDHFYNKWKKDTLVICKWLSTISMSTLPDTLENVKEVMNAEVFDIKIPNLVRSLIGTFVRDNLVQFHGKTGSGYEFLMESILKIDKLNPSVAASLASGYRKYGQLDGERKKHMRTCLEEILKESKLSKNVYEIVSKTIRS